MAEIIIQRNILSYDLSLPKIYNSDITDIEET